MVWWRLVTTVKWLLPTTTKILWIQLLITNTITYLKRIKLQQSILKSLKRVMVNRTLINLICQLECNQIYQQFKINFCLKLLRINKWLNNNNNTVFNSRKTIRKDTFSNRARIKWVNNNSLLNSSKINQLIYKLRCRLCTRAPLCRQLVVKVNLISNNIRCNSKLRRDKLIIIIIIKA